MEIINQAYDVALSSIMIHLDEHTSRPPTTHLNAEEYRADLLTDDLDMFEEQLMWLGQETKKNNPPPTQ
jgi:hypothetical protein